MKQGVIFNWNHLVKSRVHGDGAHVEHLIDNGAASSWTSKKMIELISYRACVRRRNSWMTTKQAHHSELMWLEPCARKAHGTRWFSWIWSKLMNYDWLWPRFFRATRTVTELVNNYDWFWPRFFERAACTATELMLNTPLTVMKQAHKLQREWLNSSFTEPRARKGHKQLYEGSSWLTVNLFY